MSNPLGINYALLDPRLELSSCLRCQRQLDRVDRKHATFRFEPERCAYCAVPLTAAARARLGTAQDPTRALEDVTATC